MGLKEAIERYEKATQWIDNATDADAVKHYDRYLEVIEAARQCMDLSIKELGYDPYENYEQLLNESEG